MASACLPGTDPVGRSSENGDSCGFSGSGDPNLPRVFLETSLGLLKPLRDFVCVELDVSGSCIYMFFVILWRHSREVRDFFCPPWEVPVGFISIIQVPVMSGWGQLSSRVVESLYGTCSEDDSGHVWDVVEILMLRRFLGSEQMFWSWSLWDIFPQGSGRLHARLSGLRHHMKSSCCVGYQFAFWLLVKCGLDCGRFGSVADAGFFGSNIHRWDKGLGGRGLPLFQRIARQMLPGVYSCV